MAADLGADLPFPDTERAGLILVVDDPSKRAALDETTELLDLVNLPLLGVVAIGRKGRKRINQPTQEQPGRGDGATP